MDGDLIPGNTVEAVKEVGVLGEEEAGEEENIADHRKQEIQEIGKKKGNEERKKLQN